MASLLEVPDFVSQAMTRMFAQQCELDGLDPRAAQRAAQQWIPSALEALQGHVDHTVTLLLAGMPPDSILELDWDKLAETGALDVHLWPASTSPPPPDALARIASSLERIANPAAPGPVAVRKDLDGTVTLLRGAAAEKWLSEKDLPDAPEGSPLARARAHRSTNSPTHN